MDKELGRLGALLAVGLLVAAACSSQQHEPVGLRRGAGRVGVRGSRPGRRAPRPASRRRDRRHPRHRLGRPSPATSRSAGTAASAPATRRSRSRSSSRSPRRSTPRTPASTSGSRAIPTSCARDALSVQLGVGRRSGHRRPGRHRRRRGVPRPVARPPAAHRQDRLRHDPVPAVDGRPLQRRRRGPGRHPVRDLPVGPVLQGEPVQGGRPQRAAPRVERRRTRCPTARPCRGTTTPSARSR